ncbi:MAG: RdgB/HAM1 family non-canonical purine NTP pyrophosphatase [Bacillota bacterium]|jgi:XTP/dITP diphosphohydrolase|nr:RdgB/HAM1 family non-canonical purine NTP pyrophosphatase [Bacillota bacterium]NLP21852.1 RdgB/HAM1 family non-canonical purine NTP pyrophosphatase [Erysipelotrichaceae bacterium]
MEVYIVTGNKHKLYEFKKILEPLGYKVSKIEDINNEIEETGKTFEENAIIKASYMSKKYNITCISDDSGLEIDALNKEPGIYSARYLGHDTSYEYKNNVIIERLKNATDRTCRFVCAIALVKPNGETKTFIGTIEGEVAYKIEGDNGFGYDPIFYYPPFNTTLACVSDEMKNSVSHRGKAIRKLVDYLEKNQ